MVGRIMRWRFACVQFLEAALGMRIPMPHLDIFEVRIACR
jgi:hypothetical protein